ncbi:hypothetical protein NKR23_g5930 [Pleurostoma richardsiae]|uniref:Uncharacterized protein n=1 Tax=Pleurostoma richardsiae TaxID=41990 RepID=A0AA38RMK4_9PEZI|nr:hypothetical protein NKR23_g5930 [Pleurostoma richardsiae]
MPYCVFPLERHRTNLSGCYLFLACTGCRPAEIVDDEKRKPKYGIWEALYGPKAVLARHRDQCQKPIQFYGEYVAVRVGPCEEGNNDDDQMTDEEAKLFEELLSTETTGRGRPKAPCWEDIFLMVVRHPATGKDVLAMAVKFIHHKGADNKPKPTIFFFTLAWRLIFCLVTVIISLAVHGGVFDAPSLASVRDLATPMTLVF